MNKQMLAFLLIMIASITTPVYPVDSLKTTHADSLSDLMDRGDSLAAISVELREMKIESKTEMLELKAELNDRVDGIKSDIYNKSLDAIEGRQSTLSLIFSGGGVFLAVFAILVSIMLYLMQRTREITRADTIRAEEAIDKEIEEIRKRRLTIDKVYDEMLLKEDRFKKKMEEMEQARQKTVKEAEERLTGTITRLSGKLLEIQEKAYTADIKLKKRTSISLPDEKIKLINETNAKKSVDEYEKLLFAMELEGVSKDIIPASLHKNVGLNYYKVEQYGKALDELRQHLKTHPNDIDSLMYEGLSMTRVYAKRKEVALLEQAREKFKRVTEINNKHSLAYYNWGVVLMHLYDILWDGKLLEEAIDKYGKAVAISPLNVDSYLNWGAALEKLYNERKDPGLLEEAIEKYQKAIKIKPRDFEAYCNWGAVLREQYNARKDPRLLDEAIDKYRKAVEINPQDDKSYSNWGSALLSRWYLVQEDTVAFDAKEKILKALNIAPEEKGYNYNLACAESLLGNKDKMIEALTIAFEHDNNLKKVAREDEDFEKYWGDPDFRKLTKEDDEGKEEREGGGK